MLDVLFQLCQHFAAILGACQSVHDFKLGQLHVDGVIVLAEEDSDVVLQNRWSSLDDQEDVTESNILNLWPR